MINLLKNICNNQNPQKDIDKNKDLELLSGLMIDAAFTDGQIDSIELNKIKSSLINVFNEDPQEVDFVLKEAVNNKNNFYL